MVTQEKFKPTANTNKEKLKMTTKTTTTQKKPEFKFNDVFELESTNENYPNARLYFICDAPIADGYGLFLVQFINVAENSNVSGLQTCELIKKDLVKPIPDIEESLDPSTEIIDLTDEDSEFAEILDTVSSGLFDIERMLTDTGDKSLFLKDKMLRTVINFSYPLASSYGDFSEIEREETVEKVEEETTTKTAAK